ncbi:MAG TPA: hypothetical protein VFE32_04545 [Puia sp.]|jgi:hypothetical protein|nr:hypothetical protein [Puia sp.]
MESIFEIATRISTPLMLGGVIVFAFFFIAYRVVSRLSLNNVDASNTTKIVLKIIKTFFILGLVGVVLGAAAFITEKILDKKYPRLNPTYVDLGTDRPYQLESIVRLVARKRNVTIYFDTTCDSLIKKAMIDPGHHDGENIEDFLQKLKDRVEGNSINYTVIKEGEARYEITCP